LAKNINNDASKDCGYAVNTIVPMLGMFDGSSIINRSPLWTAANYWQILAAWLEDEPPCGCLHTQTGFIVGNGTPATTAEAELPRNITRIMKWPVRRSIYSKSRNKRGMYPCEHGRPWGRIYGFDEFTTHADSAAGEVVAAQGG
jgi:hypothetical protein